MAFLSRLIGWFGRGGALGEQPGAQNPVPGESLVPGAGGVGVDGAMQISTVWSCLDRRASVVASLPFFVYEQRGEKKELARTSRLYQLLHDSPNSRMTPLEFWRALMLNHDLRGNAYARIDRDAAGEALALWPMPSDQVTPFVLDDGQMAYEYHIGGHVAVLLDVNVLHLKGLGNGTVGLSKLDYMRATTDEAAKAQTNASRIFASSGKPTGVLMLDKVLSKPQREQIQARFAEMASGSASRLYVLEADMKYQQLSISPEDQQLLETRRFQVEEICRWFDVPPVLAHHSNVTTWGSGIEQVIDGWHKFTVRPMLVSIEQAVRKRVMTPSQRARMHAEFSHDALLRGNAKDRAEIASKKVQNGLATRNEMRQLENEPPLPGGDVLTVQSNLLPINLLGSVKPRGANDPPQDPVAQ